MAAVLERAVREIRNCARCRNFTTDEICVICASPRRSDTVLCVVESPGDVLALEQATGYEGRYFVLLGRLSPLDGIGPEELRVGSLVDRIREEGTEVGEVILATNPSVEGEATAVYLEGTLRPLGVRVTRLARGIPVGSDLEYVDGSTLAEALAGRKEM